MKPRVAACHGRRSARARVGEQQLVGVLVLVVVGRAAARRRSASRAPARRRTCSARSSA